MEHEELVTVYTLKNPTQAEIIRNALENEGILCHLDGESQAGLTGIFDIDVMVKTEDADRARALIETHVPDEVEQEEEHEET